MPELPEVETIVQELSRSGVIGKKIVHAEVFWPRSLHDEDVKSFCDKICNQTIKEISRKGKFIVFSLSDNILLVHLRMTGKFTIFDHAGHPVKHTRIQLILSNGKMLCYEDQRKFGKWMLVDKSENFLEHLGLEPLSEKYTLKAFENLIENRSSQLKPFLLNQHYIAGLGNIYVDEALWEAKIHPQRPLDSLSKDEIALLYRVIPKVLKKGIANQGTTLGSSRANYFSVSGRRGTNQHQLNVFRREGQPCPRCKTLITKIRVAQRGTHICPNCQRIL